MTGHADYSTWDLAKLQQMFTLLSEALRKTHEAWELERSITGSATNYYAELADLIYRDSTQVYEALRSHPDHPLNQHATEVPLAEDTTPSAPVVKLSLSDYVARTQEGVLVNQGDTIEDFRGDRWVFKCISRAPMAGESAKVTVQRDGNDSEFYAQVFNLIIT